MSLITTGHTREGRPSKWTDPAVLEKKIDAYWAECQAEKKPFNLSMLAVYLECDRRTLVGYSDKDEFLPAIKKARRYAEATVENNLLSGKPPIGTIFVAKNNFGWKDTQTVEVNHTFDISQILALNEKAEQEQGEIIEGEILPE